VLVFPSAVKQLLDIEMIEQAVQLIEVVSKVP